MESIQSGFRLLPHSNESLSFSPDIGYSARVMNAGQQRERLAGDPVEETRQNFYTALRILEERKTHIIGVVEKTCKLIEKRINLLFFQFEQNCEVLRYQFGYVPIEYFPRVELKWTDSTVELTKTLKSEFSVTGGDLYSSDLPFQPVPDWEALANPDVSTEELELYEAQLLVPGYRQDSSKPFALGVAFRTKGECVKSVEQYLRSYQLANFERNYVRVFACHAALGHLYNLIGLNETALYYYQSSQNWLRLVPPENSVLMMRGLIETLLGKKEEQEAEYWYSECGRQAERSHYVLAEIFSKFNRSFPMSPTSTLISEVLSTHLNPNFQDWEKQYRLCYMDKA